jgi:hypothetical protein
MNRAIHKQTVEIPRDIRVILSPIAFCENFFHVIIVTLIHSDWCGVNLTPPCIPNMCYK